MRIPDQRGVLLLDALAALAVAGLAIAGGASLVHVAAQLGSSAARHDAGRAAAADIAARLEGISFARLPEVFGAAPGAAAATLDTADGTAPEEWGAVLAVLPDGAVRAELSGLGPGGARVPFDEALAQRFAVRVSWNDGPRRRSVEVVRVRF